MGSLPRLDDLAVFHHLLPSFHRTVECGFRYVVVLGYDIGDRWWDLGGDAHRQVIRWSLFDFEAVRTESSDRENIKSKLKAAKKRAG